MKRRRLTVSQQPVYNIYYNESLPIQQNLVQFPQQTQSVYSSLRPHSRMFNRNANKVNHKPTYDIPFFPEKDQRCFASVQNNTKPPQLYGPSCLD